MTSKDSARRPLCKIKIAVEILSKIGTRRLHRARSLPTLQDALCTFYQHFSSKNELLLALLDRIIAQSAHLQHAATRRLNSTATLN